jgi:hypothetical protein
MFTVFVGELDRVPRCAGRQRLRAAAHALHDPEACRRPQVLTLMELFG